MMKLVTVMLAGTLAFVSMACGKKDEAPAANVAVSGEQSAIAAPAPAAEAKAPAAAPVAAEKGATTVAAAGEDKAGCGHDMAAADEREKDCPFPEERAAVAGHPEEGCQGMMAEAEPAAVAADGSKHLGAAFTITESKPLAEVLKGAAADGQPLVRVAGTVDKVCQKKGCWMVVKDGDITARVIMKDHAFAIPFDAKGLKATVEGTLTVKVFTEAQAKHLAEDGAEDPSKVTGETKEFLLTATGVQLGG